nr:hypothetical protein [Prevotella sp.]
MFEGHAFWRKPIIHNNIKRGLVFWFISKQAHGYNSLAKIKVGCW